MWLAGSRPPLRELFGHSEDGTVSKRDYFEEITGKRARLRPRARRWQQMSPRLGALFGIMEYLASTKALPRSVRRELTKYLPIAFVAALEGHIRLVYRDLVDHGEPYVSNCPQLKDSKFIDRHAAGIRAGRASIGELGAHLIRFTGLGDIDDHLFTLMGFGFLHEVGLMPIWIEESRLPVTLNSLGRTQKVVDDVRQIFMHRHVHAHELATRAHLSLTDARQLCRAAYLFMWTVESFVGNQLEGGLITP